ncbi:uncharacterized protein E0L32_007056 [Thyridium curvatum]|uniref:Aminoglycoside phosphotransferase domain-containing protein n=1 Tax=Thyridium curvatum TaxID=1093900 RepID=A0A507B6B3_9PEZI|nr:uncharacterized protein E0L32_007056 [Thyridium curvatum]TPX12170.1 hypothetical protein E0L32_007056 [Thyridium curvatum]
MTSSTDASSISKDELILIFRTGPVIYEYGGSKVVRVSDTLVLKAGRGMTPGEAKTQEFAYEQGVRVPQVHRILKAPLPVGYEDSEEDCWLMLMDFIPGELLEQAWPSLTQEQRLGLTKTIAQLIRRLQSVTLNDLPPGPVGADDDDVYQGPYFTHYGAGPFSSVADMEAW